LLAAGYTAATLGALLISLSVGLFGFRESISASYVVESLAIETITVVALISWTVLVAAIPGGRAARGRPLRPPRPPMRLTGAGDLSRFWPYPGPLAGSPPAPGRTPTRSEPWIRVTVLS